MEPLRGIAAGGATLALQISACKHRSAPCYPLRSRQICTLNSHARAACGSGYAVDEFVTSAWLVASTSYRSGDKDVPRQVTALVRWAEAG